MTKKVSRQRAWQIRKVAQGLCALCGKGPLYTQHRCVACAKRDNAASLRRYYYRLTAVGK